MASVRKRGNRYIGLYRDADNRQKSAGTYSDEDEALARAVLAEKEANPPAAPETQILYRAETRRGMPTISVYGPVAISGAKLEPTSRETYTALFRVHVLPEFGSKGLDEIQPSQARSFARKLDDRVARGEMSSSTAYHVFGVLRLCFTIGRQDYPALTDPTADISVSRKGSKDKVIVTREEAGRLVPCLPKRYRLLGEALFATGMRFGEAMALRAADVVKKPNGKYAVRVRRSIAEIGGKHVERSYGKTSHSARDIPVEEALALRLIAAGEGGGLIFVNRNGKTPLRSTFHGIWKTACRKAGITEGFTPHGARHSLATWLANDPKVPLSAVQAMLGHASLATTSEYVHPADNDDVILAALDAA